MSGLYKRSICAVMTVLFLTMSLPGCLSLVYGREIMEGVRGEPKIDEDWRVYDLSHTFVLEGADAFSQIQESKTEQIEGGLGSTSRLCICVSNLFEPTPPVERNSHENR